MPILKNIKLKELSLVRRGAVNKKFHIIKTADSAGNLEEIASSLESNAQYLQSLARLDTRALEGEDIEAAYLRTLKETCQSHPDVLAAHLNNVAASQQGGFYE